MADPITTTATAKTLMSPQTASVVNTSIAAGGGMFSGHFNRKAQRKENARAREFADYQYNKQRNDALEDWNMQNAYNSPEQQKQRMIEAGFNPNAMYGSPQANQSGQVRPSNMSTPSPMPAAKYENLVPMLLNLFLNSQKTQAQTDNVRMQKELAEMNLKLKAFDLDFKNDNRLVLSDKLYSDVESRKQQIQESRVRSQVMLDNRDMAQLRSKDQHDQALRNVILDNARQQQMIANTSKDNQAVENAKVQLKLLNAAYERSSDENAIKAAQAALWKRGINPNDPPYARYMVEMLSKEALMMYQGGKDFLPIPKFNFKMGR